MGRRRKGDPPAYRRHKASGQAYVILEGKQEYLGPADSRESRERYEQVIREWRITHGQAAQPIKPRRGITVAEVVEEWSRRKKPFYSLSHQRRYRDVLAPLLGNYADLPAAELRSRELKSVRSVWIEKRYSRVTVNQYTSYLKKLWKWAIDEELVDAESAASMLAVAPLDHGSHGLPENEPVLPVPLRDLAGTLRTLSPRMADMLRVLYRIGCRPGELCRMKGTEITQKGTVEIAGRHVQVPPGLWAWKPEKHKNRHRSGPSRYLVYLIGPRTQKILKRYLRANQDEYLWQPREVVADVQNARRKGAPPSAKTLRRRNPERPHSASERYSTKTLDGAIARACKRAEITAWSANQLRHNAASRADAAFGIQAASSAMGHTQLNTTAIYTERTLRSAAEVAARLG